MNGKNIYKLWAPKNAKWVDWVRPVPFIGIIQVKQFSTQHNFEIVNISYIDKSIRDTAYIVDLPDYESIVEGIGFAKKGFRPIPLYNGTTPQPNAMSLVDNNAIQEALVWGASQLKRIAIDDGALPVFLLDSNRLLRFKMNASIFDNSWDLYEQDIPSCEYFLKNGITKIVVRAEKVQRDLARILYKFQKKGILILLTNGYEKPRVIRIKKPPRKDKFH
jgi:hypothetical protein